MHVLYPDGNDTGIELLLTGHDTKTFRDTAKNNYKECLTKKLDPQASFERDIEQNLTLVAACIVGWTGLENDDGTEMLYSPKKALEIISMPEFAFMREQVEEFIAERKNFFRPVMAVS